MNANNTPPRPGKRAASRNPVVVILLLMGGAFFWWSHLNRVPEVTVPTPTLPKPNAYDVFVQAGDAQVNKEAVGDAILTPERLRDQKREPLTPEQKEGLLVANAPALETLRRGFDFPYLNPPARSFTAPFPEFAKFRALARLLLLEGQMREARGENGGAANSYLDAMRVGHEVPRGGVLIARLVGVACEAIGRRPLWALSEKLSAEEARHAAARMEALNARRTPLADTLREEMWLGQAGLAEVFRKNNNVQILGALGLMTGEGEDTEYRNWHLRAQGMMLITPKSRILDNYTGYLTRLSERATHPYGSQPPLPPLPNDLINKILLPVFEPMFVKEADTQTQNALLTLVLALRAYEAEKGAYPATLDELTTGGYLTTIPADPFSRNAAAPGYRLTETKYVLYSVGPDGVDDGGAPIDNRDSRGQQKRWAEAGTKGDYVVGINLY